MNRAMLYVERFQFLMIYRRMILLNSDLLMRTFLWGAPMFMRLISILLLVVFTPALKADILGVHGGVGFWAVDLDGDSLTLDTLSHDLDFSSENGLTAYLALEHPVPLIPNIKVAYAKLSDFSDNTIGQGLILGDIPFDIRDAVSTRVDLTHADLVLYFEVVDIGFDLDIGVAGRYFMGDVSVGNLKEDVDSFLPMLYASTKFGLPFSGLYLGAEVNAGTDVQDYQFKIGWATENAIFPEFGIETGYRNFDLDADEIDLDTDMEVDGIFVNLTAHF